MLQGVLVEELFLSPEEVWRSDDVVLAGRGLYGLQVDLPVNRWSELADLRQAHLVVDVLGVAALDVIHLRLGQSGFNFDDLRGIGTSLRFPLTCQGEHLLQMLAIFT